MLFEYGVCGVEVLLRCWSEFELLDWMIEKHNWRVSIRSHGLCLSPGLGRV